MKRVAVIGSGFSGLSAAAYLAKAGYEVHVYEKNAGPGGRARQLSTPEGYVFDMGPSWYWMPDVFEKFFQEFGYTASDFYHLQLLHPAFDMVFETGKTMPVPNNIDQLAEFFESIEPGASKQLHKFLAEAERKYKLSMDKFIYQPGLSVTEFLTFDVIRKSANLTLFSSFSKHVRKYFSNARLIALMEFPVLFLGAMPKDTPALYSLMNYAGLKLGTWYPQGGFGKVVDAFVSVAKEQGVVFHFNACVEQIITEQDQIKSIRVNGETHLFDGVVASADYHHVEQKLLPEKLRNYTNKYWDKKTFAPSCLIFYIGVKKRIAKLNHHTLFFDENLDQHARDIYKTPAWPDKPLFYVSCTSKTDKGVAPDGNENLFVLIPIAPGLTDEESTRERYFKLVMDRLEKHTGESIVSFIDYKKSYCVKDFTADYNAYKGNAYGLANTISQTAMFKPKAINNRIKNMFYTGQLTVPGPGVPPAIISGKISAELMSNFLKSQAHEISI